MYIDPKTPKIGSLYGSQPVGASVQQLLGLSEKIVPTAGPLSVQTMSTSNPNQNGSTNHTVSVGWLSDQVLKGYDNFFLYLHILYEYTIS